VNRTYPLAVQLALLIVLGALLPQFARGEATSPANSDEVIRKLKDSERKLINLRLTSSSFEETMGADGKTWNRTPVETEADVYLNGLPGSKGRIDFHKRVLEWIKGPSPYGLADFSVAFNGIKGSLLYRRQGAYDKPFFRFFRLLRR